MCVFTRQNTSSGLGSRHSRSPIGNLAPDATTMRCSSSDKSRRNLNMNEWGTCTRCLGKKALNNSTCAGSSHSHAERTPCTNSTFNTSLRCRTFSANSLLKYLQSLLSLLSFPHLRPNGFHSVELPCLATMAHSTSSLGDWKCCLRRIKSTNTAKN